MTSALRSKLLAASTVAALACATGVPAVAQQNITPPAAAGAGAIDESQVEAFAEASLAVQDVAERWNPRIQEAESQEQAEQLRTEATQEMAQAITSSGLEIQTYDEIYQAAQSNPQLAQEIQRKRMEMQ